MSGGVYIYSGHHEPQDPIISVRVQNILFTLSVFLVMSSFIAAIVFFLLNRYGLISKSTPNKSQKQRGTKQNNQPQELQQQQEFVGENSSHALMDSVSTHSIGEMDSSNFSTTSDDSISSSNKGIGNGSRNVNMLEEGSRKSKVVVLEIHQ